MFRSIGVLRYSKKPIKIIVEADPEICNFYRSLVPKYIPLARQMYVPHISVVRKETPTNMDVWNKYNNQEIEFEYDNFIYNDEIYYWLNCYSKRLEDIRLELGLSSTSLITRSPDGRHKFHMTIGNLKNKGT
jgi:hypothetical protein